ncbi:sodium/potassium-transporting ATPase subunit beta-like [Penaeus japonicus]|uniref:sodium/potassium-transporting ATPase subunit beta-like n=1 Tax=Penaeus japonicus TaxID=27405 RepID=UPI001C70C857|nr:sodium/potassium-transporting ATPase subunit beta-like [Penaeus japonicus]BDT61727.1 MAG: sodium/potassium-transporting ATPase subunit beta-like protein [Marsupenaeus japonicus endogenous nimavirus]
MTLNTSYKVLIGVLVAAVVLGGGLTIHFIVFQEDTSSGLNVIPRRDIRFKEGNQESAQTYVDEMNNFLMPYFEIVPNEKYIKCNSSARPKGDQVCIFPESYLGACDTINDYSFNKNSPCVLLTLSMDDSFRLKPYERLDELPEDIPPDLRIDIEDEAKLGKLKKGIYIDCTNEYLYTPGPIFPDYYFDNIDVAGYLPPVVGVKIKLHEKNKTVKIECKLWAKNIDHTDKRSKVSFIIHME